MSISQCEKCDSIVSIVSIEYLILHCIKYNFFYNKYKLETISKNNLEDKKMQDLIDFIKDKLINQII